MDHSLVSLVKFYFLSLLFWNFSIAAASDGLYFFSYAVFISWLCSAWLYSVVNYSFITSSSDHRKLGSYGRMLDEVMYIAYLVPGSKSSKKMLPMPSSLVAPEKNLYLLRGLLSLLSPERI